MNSLQVEIAVAAYFTPRVNLIVPNVSWGFHIHEVDMMVVTPAGCVYEVEIKVSRADLKADLRKGHGHHSKIIRKLYFAIPEALLDSVDLVPERAGILVIREDMGTHICKCWREAKTNVDAPKLSDKQRYQIARLGTMRIWSLKKKIQRIITSERLTHDL